LKLIGERSLLGHVLDRTRRVKRKCSIVIATTERTIDDPIVEFADKEGIKYFRGSLDDVSGRALACSDYFGFDSFVRICGDRPFLEPTLIDILLKRFKYDNLDLATNALKKTYPTGLMTEVVSVASLRQAMSETDEPEDHEHVTRYFYRKPDKFKIWNLESTAMEYKTINLAVDTIEDFKRTKWIVEQLGSNAMKTSLSELVQLALDWERTIASS
tara:strand:+ start:580 stop:1224 length:645 start_codon:yes stop_codon:yes gene_type:complete